jgi:hypothetical protein
LKTTKITKMLLDPLCLRRFEKFVEMCQSGKHRMKT